MENKMFLKHNKMHLPIVTSFATTEQHTNKDLTMLQPKNYTAKAKCENKSVQRKIAFFKTTISFHRLSNTKFCALIVILLCAIYLRTSHAIPVPNSGQRLILHTNQYREQRHQKLLQEQRSLVLPTPHRHHLHHRSIREMQQTANGSSGKDEPDFCRPLNEIRQQLRDAKLQAKTTFNFIDENLEEFTRILYEDTPINASELFRLHSLRLQHPYNTHPDVVNFSLTDPEVKSLHLKNEPLNRATLIKEFQNMNATLNALDSVFTEILIRREENKTSLIRDLMRTNVDETQAAKRFELVNKTMSRAHEHLKQDLSYIHSILESFKIEPQEQGPVDYYRPAEFQEWLVMKDHLGVINYFHAIYKYLLSRNCEN